jgi:hypothetical protein
VRDASTSHESFADATHSVCRRRVYDRTTLRASGRAEGAHVKHGIDRVFDAELLFKDSVGEHVKISRLVRTASTVATALAACSTSVLLLKLLFLNKYPEIFFGAYDLGVLVDATLTSIIASYIFYLLVVHLKEQSDKDAVAPYVAKHARRIVGDCQGQLIELSKKSGVAMELAEITKVQIEAAFQKIDPNSAAQLLISASGRYANWLEFLLYRIGRTRVSARKLLDQLPLLEGTLIQMIASIDDSSYFLQVDMVCSSGPITNKDMTFLCSGFYDYCALCQNLNKYLEASA